MKKYGWSDEGGKKEKNGMNGFRFRENRMHCWMRHWMEMRKALLKR